MLLNDVNEGMILAQDVVNNFGQTLITAGKPLTLELLRLLEKHGVSFIFVQSHPYINREIDHNYDLISMETRLNLISHVKKAFISSEGLAKNLTQLQDCVENIVSGLLKHKSVLMFLNNINFTSDYLFMHSVNVGLFSIVIGIAMKLPYEELCILGMGGLLHDFGKTRINKRILDKQCELTMAEFLEVKEHSSIGYNILKFDTTLDYRIMFMALQHHERCDGSGYPWGISKTQIHPLARIVAVADVYDALTTDRVYRSRLTSMDAMEIINASNKIHFDVDVLKAFNEVAIPYHIGDNVKLNTGVDGKVVRLNSSNLIRPLISTSSGIVNLLCELETTMIASSY
jgi:HD-GYP domain-containing protein (c-di-GMP phosphodiesterase class II)